MEIKSWKKKLSENKLTANVFWINVKKTEQKYAFVWNRMEKKTKR